MSRYVFVFTAVLPDMLRQNSGHIVAISSIQGKLAIPFRSACICVHLHFLSAILLPQADSFVASFFGSMLDN